MFGQFQEAVPGESWVCATEMPNGSLRLEGIKRHPEKPESFRVYHTIFSRKAIEKLVPILQAWLDNDNKEIQSEA